MKIGVNCGHTLSGLGTGAVGIVKETDKNREVGKRLMAMLREKGHTVVDCTVDNSSNDLYDIRIKANAQPLDVFVSLHLNAFNGTAYGVETYIYNGSWSGKEANKAIAKRVNDELASQVGWYNRGVKEANFYVLRETVAPAILCELGFCDSSKDMNLWNTEKIAKALFKGITGVEYVAPAPPTSGGTTFYRVVAGSYSNRKNADDMVAKLKGLGVDSFIDIYKK